MKFSLGARSALACFSLLFLCSCPNVFDPLSSPSGEAQLLSAARAAFDQGDLALAREYYAQLGNNDSAESELAFTYLNEAGVTMSALVTAVKIKDGESVGSILTNLSESLISGAGVARRTLLAQAFAKVGGIETKQLRGFTRFITAIAIAASTLAEHSGAQANGQLNKSDIVQNTTSCTIASCVANTNCGEPVPTVFSSGGSNDQSTYTSNTSTSINLGGTSPTYWMFINSLQAAQQGLSEMGVSTGDSLTLVNQILTVSFTSGSAAEIQCLRATLIERLGVGRS